MIANSKSVKSSLRASQIRGPVRVVRAMATPEPAAPAAAAAAPTGTAGLSMMKSMLDNNRAWSKSMLALDKDFFNRLTQIQTPKFLWLGCSDSRVPANQVLGLAPGEVFVQRNVGNQVHLNDMNLMSCMEFAVNNLKVKCIIVCGHYNCGAVKGGILMPKDNPSMVNAWIHDIKQCRDIHSEELDKLEVDDRVTRLCELNVLRQTHHVVNSPVVQNAWAEGRDLTVYGVIYSLKDGLLLPLAGPLTKDSDLTPLFDCVIKGSAMASKTLSESALMDALETALLMGNTPPAGSGVKSIMTKA